MSIRAMNWVWESSQTVGNARLVLLAIADRASDEGMDAWPSVATLARKTALHVRTVQRCIRSIQALGELDIKTSEGARGTNVYIVRMDAHESKPAREKRRSAPVAIEPSESPITPGNLSPPGNLPPGGDSAGGGVTLLPPGGGTAAGGGVTLLSPNTSRTSGTSCTSKTNTSASPTLALARDPNPGGNFHVIAKLAFDLVRQGWWEFNGQRFVIDSESTLTQALKDECPRLRMDRTADELGDVVHRVARLEWFKHTHPEIADRPKAVNA